VIRSSDSAKNNMLCQAPGCNRPTFNGRTGYCSRTCRDKMNLTASQSVKYKCQAPGCNRYTFNGQPGYCSITCRDKPQSTASQSVEYKCKAPGCNKPTFNKQPGYCSWTCRDRPQSTASQSSKYCFPDGPIGFYYPDGPIGFYYPGRDEPIDKKYKASMLGNFYPVDIIITAPKWKNSLHFINTEAAYQALKYEYSVASLFCNDTGNRAFKRKLSLPNQNFVNSGFKNSWEAMLYVLRAKFNNNIFRIFLLNTGNSFLVEHNSRIGRDLIWSNNCDGTGYNWLGFQLMLIRAELNNATEELDWLDSMLNLKTGEFKNKKEWTDLVMHFTRLL